MSVGNISLIDAARSWREEPQRRWHDARPATRTRVQIAVFVVAVLVAYHYSLSTLLQSLNMDTPLAYVGLVPVLALALAAALHRPQRREPAIHDRQLDYIVGLPLIAGAVVINLVVPRHLTDLFWIWRLDLLSLPLFVAGVMALIFGVRVLWRQKLAVLYLLLAWPLPYSVVLLRVLDGFTNLTITALKAVTGLIPVAQAIPGSDGSLFQITHAGRSFPLSVVSACSGVNGVVGFLLVGLIFAVTVRGPRLRKALWLIGGMVLLWMTNLGRLIFIFWAGRTWGEEVAIHILHPFVGLLTFSAGVLLMMLVLRPLGLQIGWSADPRPAVDESHPLAVPRILSAVAIVAIAALVLGVTNGRLRTYDLVANAAGEPKLASYSLDPATPAGWAASFQTSYTWAKPYFGGGSTWYRFLYTPASPSNDLYSSLPVTADVVNTTNLNSFSAYGVEACYKFHGYSLRDVAQVGLGAGIKGQALSYDTSSHGDWSIVYWIWPVKSAGATHFERVILYLQDTLDASVRVPAGVSGIKSLQGALDPHNQYDARLIQERAFLVQFAREVVEAQAAVKPGSQLPGLAVTLASINQPITPVSKNFIAQRAQRLGYISHRVNPSELATGSELADGSKSATVSPSATVPPSAPPSKNFIRDRAERLGYIPRPANDQSQQGK